MRKILLFMVIAVITVSFPAVSLPKERVLLKPDTLDSDIIFMRPDEIDPSLLPLDSIEDLHTTGIPPEIDLKTWRLEVFGENVRNPLSLSYEELKAMNMVKKKAILICPSFFADYAEWEGVPLADILKLARVKKDYKKVIFKAEDGYRTSFDKNEIEKQLLFLALSVNGEVLPKEHGFPVRLVAEDTLGGSWVKWLSSIKVD